MSTLLTFIVPVRHQANARHWPELKQRLAQTLASIASQDHADWRGIVVANWGADLPEMPAGFEVERVDFAPNTLHELGNATKEQFYEGTVAVAELKGADGAEVSLKVVAEQHDNVLTVPIAAVRQNGSGKDVVRVLDLAHNGTVTEVEVTTGLSEDSYIEIRTGLKGGEVVVVEVDKKS